MPGDRAWSTCSAVALAGPSDERVGAVNALKTTSETGVDRMPT